jgi:hypothetical protein
MIEENPAWEYRNRLSELYGHVDTFEGRVVGTWFCLDATNGEVIWEKPNRFANSIRGCSRGIIAATKSKVGMGLSNHGAFGMSLKTGDLVWRYPQRGAIGGFFREIGLLNEKDAAKFVSENQVHCASGRLIDINVGLLLPKTTVKEPELTRPHDVESGELYYEGVISVNKALGQILSSRPGGVGRPPEVTAEWLKGSDETVEEYPSGMRGHTLYGLSDDDPQGWKFDSRELGYSTDTNYFAYRYHRPYVYLIAKEGEYYKPEEEGKPLENRKAACRILVLDARKGEIVQDILLPEPAHEFRIESIDNSGILVSHSNAYLALYRFSH